MDVIPFTERNAIFARLGETASRLNLNDAERVRYNDELKKYRDYFSTLDYAKDSGRREGEEKGREEGRVEGIGIGEKRKQLEIAHNLKTMGLSSEQIKSATGLSITEIEKL